MPPSISADSYPRVLAENLWVLGIHYFNLYLVRGVHSAALIEIGVSGMIDTALQQLATLGVAPDYLVLTHPHADHITGLNALLERFPDAQIVAGRGARQFAFHPKAIQNMQRDDHFLSQSLAAQGLPPARAPLSELNFPQNHICVAETHAIDLGGIVLHCRAVAGHAPGHIVVHMPALGALVPSDAMGFHFPGRSFVPLFLTEYRGYLATLEWLASLQPQILCMAHQGPLTGSACAQALRQARRAAEELLARVAAHHGDDAQLAEAIFQETYHDEFALYSAENIRGVAGLLVRRAREYLAA